MRKLLMLAVAIGSLSFAGAQQLRTPSPSPEQTIKQGFALSDIELTYSRPGIKSREIFGDLVPYGKVWRTGANAATTLTFGDEVTIGGTKVPAGKYGLLTIPGQDEWIIIISKQTNVTSPSAYKDSEDVVRVKAQPARIPETIESFMIVVDQIKPSSMEIVILWENTVVSFPVTSDIDSKVMASIDELMKSEKPPYFQAAMYYAENGKDMKKAA